MFMLFSFYNMLPLTTLQI